MLVGFVIRQVIICVIGLLVSVVRQTAWIVAVLC